MPNIVLLDGTSADGSCWTGVIERLQADGYDTEDARGGIETFLTTRKTRWP